MNNKKKRKITIRDSLKRKENGSGYQQPVEWATVILCSTFAQSQSQHLLTTLLLLSHVSEAELSYSTVYVTMSLNIRGWSVKQSRLVLVKIQIEASTSTISKSYVLSLKGSKLYCLKLEEQHTTNKVKQNQELKKPKTTISDKTVETLRSE